MSCRTQAAPPPAAAPKPVSLEDQAKILSEEVPHQIERLRWLAEHEKLHWGTYQIRKRALLAAADTLSRLAERTARVDRLREVITSDAAAITCQTLGQYRTMLLRELDGVAPETSA